jgi:hypothetical protein
MNSLFYKTKLNFDYKIASPYMLLLWLSHDKNLVFLCNRLNLRLYRHTNKAVYEILFDAVPKGKRFIKWIKKEEKPKKNKEIEYLMVTHNMSEREAYLTLGI